MRGWRRLGGNPASRSGEDGFLATVDGLLGMQAKLPLRSPLREWVALLNEEPKLGVRFAVDLPTGLTGDSVESGQILRADFTYCAGIVKSPVLHPDQAERVGRLRYLDLGFFESSFVLEEESSDQVLRSSALEVLRRERPTLSDKRSFGHLLLLAGSRDYAGAAMMAAQAALKAGVGLLTVGIPESLHAAFAALRPEAMWIPLPETPEGGLALEGLGKVRSLLGRINALAAGPGIGSDPESHALIRETLGHFSGPRLTPMPCGPNCSRKSPLRSVWFLLPMPENSNAWPRAVPPSHMRRRLEHAGAEGSAHPGVRSGAMRPLSRGQRLPGPGRIGGSSHRNHRWAPRQATLRSTGRRPAWGGLACPGG